MSEYKICPFCHRDERVGGAWVDSHNPCVMEDRGLILKARVGQPRMHALCMLLEKKGYYVDKDNKLKRRKMIGDKYERK